MSEEIWNDLDALIREGRHVTAVKLYREKFRVSLTEAKEIIEARIEVLFPPK